MRSWWSRVRRKVPILGNIPAGCSCKTGFMYYTCKSCADGCLPKNKVHRRTCTPNFRRKDCRFGSFTKAQECYTQYNPLIIILSMYRRYALMLPNPVGTALAPGAIQAGWPITYMETLTYASGCKMSHRARREERVS